MKPLFHTLVFLALFAGHILAIEYNVDHDPRFTDAFPSAYTQFTVSAAEEITVQTMRNYAKEMWADIFRKDRQDRKGWGGKSRTFIVMCLGDNLSKEVTCSTVPRGRYLKRLREQFGYAPRWVAARQPGRDDRLDAEDAAMIKYERSLRYQSTSPGYPQGEMYIGGWGYFRKSHREESGTVAIPCRACQITLNILGIQW
jgi:hypothetical protein